MNNSFKKIVAERAANVKRINQQIDLLELAKEYFNVEPHGTKFKLTEHSSCVIDNKNNKFHRYSTGAYGNVFDFLAEFEECGNLSFNEAYNFLLKRIDPNVEIKATNDKKKTIQDTTNEKIMKCHIHLNKQLNSLKDENSKNAIAYLIKERKINPSLVFELLDRKMMMQLNDNYGKKVAFLGYNPYGFLSAGCCRACTPSSTFKGDLESCDYNWGWFYSPNYDKATKISLVDYSKPLVCFESYIDMLSYITLLNKNQDDIHAYNYLSCGSVAKSNCILNWQKQYNINDIILAFDNDEAGLKGMESCKKMLLEKGCNVRLDISERKDWNEQLIKDSALKNRKNIAISKKNDIKKSVDPIVSDKPFLDRCK